MPIEAGSGEEIVTDYNNATSIDGGSNIDSVAASGNPIIRRCEYAAQ